jgi:hypothetical protein
MNNQIALITWTHNEYSDIWPLYFGRLDKHVNYQKSYIFLDEQSDKIEDKHIQLVNNDKEPFYKRFMDCLNQIDEEYVLYLQEDHIFYDDCQEHELDRVFEFLKNNDYSCVRLIKSGELGGPQIAENLYEIPKNSTYSFSQQSAIWKRADLLKLFELYKPNTYRDVEAFGSTAMRYARLKSCYYYNNEPQRGSLHYDSSIFPYVATAVCKGQWNLSQYPKILKEALEEYQVDHTIRGLYGG